MRKFQKGKILGKPINRHGGEWWEDQARRNPIWQRAMNEGNMQSYDGELWYVTPYRPGGNGGGDREIGAGCCVNGCGCGCICARNCQHCMCNDARNFKRPQPGDCPDNYTW